MKSKIIISCFVLFVACICRGTEMDLGRSLVGAIVKDAWHSALPDVPKADDGEGKGPFIDTNNPTIRYVGRPRKCSNFPDGKVNAGTKNGIHRVRVMRQKNIGNAEVENWRNDGFVTADDNDDQTIEIGIGDIEEWSLAFVGDYGIYINCASGKMEGNFIGSAISYVIGGLVGLI